MTTPAMIFRSEIHQNKKGYSQFSVTAFEKGSPGVKILLSAYTEGSDSCLYLTEDAAHLLGKTLIEAAEKVGYAAPETANATQELPNDRILAGGPVGEQACGVLPAAD